MGGLCEKRGAKGSGRKDKKSPAKWRGNIHTIDPLGTIGGMGGWIDHYANAEHIMRDLMFGFRHNKKNSEQDKTPLVSGNEVGPERLACARADSAG